MYIFSTENCQAAWGYVSSKTNLGTLKTSSVCVEELILSYFLQRGDVCDLVSMSTDLRLDSLGPAKSCSYLLCALFSVQNPCNRIDSMKICFS